jgi:hypothetical protein
MPIKFVSTCEINPPLTLVHSDCHGRYSTFVPDTLSYQLSRAARERCNVADNSQWPIPCFADVCIRRRAKYSVGWRIDVLSKNSCCKYPLPFHFVVVLVRSSTFVVFVRIMFLECFMLSIPLCIIIENKSINQIAVQHNYLLNKFTKSVEATCFGSYQ